VKVEVRREVVFPAAREEVWEALTDPRRLEEWFANEVSLDLCPGGEGRFRWDNGEERLAVVETVERERRLAFDWSDPDGEATSVDFTLDEVPEGTRLTVVESAPAGPQASAGEWALALEWQALDGNRHALVA